jgi:hypothetical protein
LNHVPIVFFVFIFKQASTTQTVSLHLLTRFNLRQQQRPSVLTPIRSPSQSQNLDPIDRRLHIRRGPSARYRRERERVHSNTSSKDLINLLVSEEHEAKTTRKLLYTALDRLDSSNRHADSTEERCRILTESLMKEKLDASRAREELALYKLQLDAAQKEIFRAQEILSAVEGQRDEAEASAAKARTTARLLNEEHLVRAAREEGRRLGFEEGLRRGRQIGFENGHEIGYDDGRSAIHGRMIDRDVPDTATDADQARDQDSFGREYPEMRPESIRIRTPSIANHPIQDIRAPPTARRASTSASSIARTENPPRPQSTHTQASTRTRRNSDVSIPPEGWIPQVDGDAIITLPPPHELTPAPILIPSTTPPLHDRSHEQPQNSSSRPYSQAQRRSTAESISSTATGISQLDLVSFPNSSFSARDKGKMRGLSVIREGSTSPVRSSGRDASGSQPLSPRWGWPDPEQWNRREVEVRYVYSCHSLRLMFRSPLYVLCVTRHPPEQIYLRMSSALQYNQGTHALPWVHPRPNNPNEQCRLGRLGARASRSKLYRLYVLLSLMLRVLLIIN